MVFGAVGKKVSSDRESQAVVSWHGIVRKEFRSRRKAKMLAEAQSAKASTSWLSLQTKVTAQSSTAHGGSYQRAVDGVSVGEYGKRSCTHTAERGASWWEVNLGDPIRVSKIQLSTRSDIGNWGTPPLSIAVDRERCAEVQAFPAKHKPIEVECRAKGSKIRLNATGGLVLCEIKIAPASWKTICPKGVCEHQWYLRNRLSNMIQDECRNVETTLDACKECCLDDTRCAAIDWYSESKVCQRYTAACNISQSSSSHHGGSSYALS
eukprot:TRINITY_DN18148_c0_g1_i2.p1 TRINITY_DN18148_c0_g1~~TRINITY_DN18148_c0_g1_i2.p1  ORF type:complete len:298 (-),score=10.39 TRINITY_DN18148_c0_g1_i2:51-845(-)